METFRMPKTKRGALRQCASLLSKCRRDLAGGLSFGLDWQTVRVTFPERYAHIKAMRAAFESLPS